MTFEERKEINRLVKSLPTETRVILDRMSRWHDMALEEGALAIDFDCDDPREHIHGENSFYAERRILQLFDELIETGALRALIDLARLAEADE